MKIESSAEDECVEPEEKIAVRWVGDLVQKKGGTNG
jgi:hypothetical protein